VVTAVLGRQKGGVSLKAHITKARLSLAQNERGAML
jgi:hypothetical protein